ncbi:adenylate/guanylate cyclase domain-containing protein [Neolewinella persica]|uniref:adenylate/guanylate cyclase domain-containing protein n=1 Tax=Neolewinella persica TaxID=70998 RepID=UPI00036A27D9|nr:adenylate/guanylate cyclase domain-containing protein [Neolewinella persica]
MFRLLILLVILLSAPAVSAQADNFDGQVTAIEQLIEKKRFKGANAQAKALVESGLQARLPLVEAEGRLLLGLSILEDPKATAKERVAGIHELRKAAQGFRKDSKRDKVAEVVALLKEFAGDESIDLQQLPSSRPDNLPLIPSADSLESISLEAIVSLQQKEITALNDSQLRQVILLERQQNALDVSEFSRLNDSVLLLRQEQIIDRQQTEVTTQRLQRNLLIGLALATLVVLGVIYSRFRSSQRYRAKLEIQNAIIVEERQRSEELLLNILPVSVAAELKETGKATARLYESTTVLFADFKGFSRLAASTEPEVLINLLDEAFRAFDEIISEHGLEKIKTIGDAYMCAGGLPEEIKDHAQRAVRAGLAMQAYLNGNSNFDARIGVHSGPVVAGVVGKHKFVYDIWGDTVNQASRLEVAGEIGRVAVSRTTRDLLGKDFVCEAAGSFEAKNIGLMERFFVTKS